MIPNHFAHRLSDLDLVMAQHVPPGGNWKNIPAHVPSKRLEQIRISFAAGEGSRSTYYGRLMPDRPAYTVTTYFNRPGNGCFLHYDFAGGQHRTISQREAARIQSFPDGFEFLGSRQSINKQIGNAVPPLLAYQIAKTFPEPGAYVDLFCGAGGLSLGFKWAGWKHVIGSDIDPSFIATYQRNIRRDVVVGDIARANILADVIDAAHTRLRRTSNGPTVVIGGPPCQGFSTAGNRRSMDDLRNHLFKQYAAVLGALKADAFIFENVPGLLNMQAGRIFRTIGETLERAGYALDTWILNSVQFGIPQRRVRVFIVGIRPSELSLTKPVPLTDFQTDQSLFGNLRQCWSVRDALGDLPPINAGDDGSDLAYRDDANNEYRAFLRGSLPAEAYFNAIQSSAVAA